MPARLPRDDEPAAGAVPQEAADERQWLAGIRAGDERAFEAMFRAYYHGLGVYAARLLGSDAAAEELVQDLLLKIWQMRDRLEVTGSLGGYLYGAVRKRALAQLRHERVERRWQEDAVRAETNPAAGRPPPLADERVRSAELAAAIDHAVERLSPRCREAYLLRRQHHLSYAEIARIMGIAPKTVEIQIGAALKALRAELAEWLV